MIWHFEPVLSLTHNDVTLYHVCYVHFSSFISVQNSEMSWRNWMTQIYTTILVNFCSAVNMFNRHHADGDVKKWLLFHAVKCILIGWFDCDHDVCSVTEWLHTTVYGSPGESRWNCHLPAREWCPCKPSNWGITTIVCMLMSHILGGPKKVVHYVWRLTSSAYIWINFRDFWHTSTSGYSEHTYLFNVPQIHHTKWHLLAKVNN